jgi:YkoY family integral membrane protein
LLESSALGGINAICHMIADLLAAADLWIKIQEALPVILSLVLIEGLLSVDNALAIAAMARHLDNKQRQLAMNIGYIGAYGFRVVALLVASWIIENHWIMLLGALYLVWLMCAHFVGQKEQEEDEGEAVNVHHRTFGATIVMISLMDLSLSVDNVVAAIALSPDKLWPVYVGVTIGIVALRLIAGVAVKLIEKYPVLEHTAFILVGYVGLLLLAELQFPETFQHISPAQLKIYKFGGIVLLTSLTIAWSQVGWLQKLLKPFLQLILIPMNVLATLIGAVIVVITTPFKVVWAIMGKKPA